MINQLAFLQNKNISLNCKNMGAGAKVLPYKLGFISQLFHTVPDIPSNNVLLEKRAVA
jgi:hypothetical protein